MATVLKLPVILYFINGSMPSEGDIKAAEKYEGKAKVVFRNAFHVNVEDGFEKADGVMGAVPPHYKERYPSAEEALKGYEKDKKDLSDRVGDEPAPKVTNVDSDAPVSVKDVKTSEKKTASVWKAGK